MLNDDHVQLINEIHFQYYFDEEFFLENQFLKKNRKYCCCFFLFKPFCFSFNSSCCFSAWISWDLSTFNKAIYCCCWCKFIWLLCGLCTIWNALFSLTDGDKADFGLEQRLSNVPKSCSIIWIGARDERFCSIINDIGNESSWLLLLLLFILTDGKIWRKCERFFFSEDFIDDDDDDDNVAKPLVLLCTVRKWPDVEDDDNDEVTAEGTKNERHD